MESTKKMELIQKYYDQMNHQEFREHLIKSGFEILEEQPGVLIFEDESNIEEFEIESFIQTAAYRSPKNNSMWEVQSVVLRNVG